MKHKLVALSKSILVKLLIVIIIAVFALWGVGDMFSAGKTNVVAEVSGKNIYSEDYVNQLRNGLQSKNYQNISDAIKDNLHIQILNQLVAEKIFEIYAEEEKIIINDKTLSNFIKNIPEFSKNGKFSRTEYEKYLLKNQIDSYSFETSFKKSLLKKLIVESQNLGSISTSYHKTKVKNYFEKKISISYINLEDLYEDIDIAEKEILDYHKKNPSYSNELRSIKYAIINQNKEANQSSDLFFKNISDIENQVLSNRNFDDIATQFSLNVKKSGLFNKDGLIKNSLKTTALDKSIVQKTFYLNDQITSELIEIKGSFYLIGINEIVKKKTLTLNDKIKKNIINKIKKKNIDSKANSLSNKIKEENIFNQLVLKKTKFVKQLELKNRLEENKTFSPNQIQEIFSLKKNESLVLKGSKNYLIKAIDTSYDRTKSNDEMDKLYERQVTISFDEQIMQSFDKFLNNKYKVKINQKVLDRITNSF
ncbi:MAG: SurA N-terminal domain-containing protein [Candidatus Pelagibacter sp.]|nr:SurA N-terminal domain-containing protein [Candidatus Pelagibacter sp.]